MDLYTQYAPLPWPEEAVNDSGLDVENEDLNRIGVIFGAGIGGIRTFEEEGRQLCPDRQGKRPEVQSPFFIPR